MPYCIGLTGGIGSGKSSAARVFEELGVGIVDTDEISHALTRPGGAAIPQIKSEFGADYIAEDGSLDRTKMRQLVFADPGARKRLEAILHPLIGQETRVRVAAAAQPYVILAVPLLLESNAYLDLVKRIAVVDCSEAQQIERTMRRSALSEQQVRAIMASQVTRKLRLARADDVLDNSGDSAGMRHQVEALHEKYLALAARG
jgi:dephospho-CoA kinase